MSHKLLTTLVFLASTSLAGQALAITNPYTESFSDGASGWTSGTNPNQIVASGGADGGAYFSTVASPTASGFGAVTVLFRCESGACSDGAFLGDWRDEIVLSWYFRHDADVALQAYARIAAPSNNPGASAVVSTLVQPNTWTRIDLAIEATNPAFISFSNSNFDGVFNDVGRVQLGISLPTGFSGSNLHFDVDAVSLSPVPEPQTYALLGAGMALLAAVSRRRRR